MQISPKKRIPRKSIVYVFLCFLLFGIFAVLVSINLENQVIVAYDEARHGVNAYEMIRNDDWLIHTYQGEPDHWNLKPPFSFWVIALNFKLFGYHCVAFRLHSIIAATILLLWITLWTKKRFGETASFCVLLFLIINQTLYNANFARRGEADAMHILFFTVSMLLLFDSQKDFRKLYGSAFCFGLSFMTKSYHAALIPVLCFGFMLCTGGIRKLTLRRCLSLLFWALLPILPWAIARYVREGFVFFIEMFTTDVLSRATFGEGMPAPWYFYADTLIRNHTVVASAALGIGIVTWQSIEKRRFFLTKFQLLLLLWILVPLILYSFSARKINHYILPITIPLSMTGGLSFAKIFQHCRFIKVKSALALLLAAGALFQLTDLFRLVLSLDNKGSLQTTLVETLDRDLDAGKHMYVQYGTGRTVWMQNDMLRALLSGDVICIDGGIEAFLEDEEPALIVIDKTVMNYDLMEDNPLYYEQTYYYVLENLY